MIGFTAQTSYVKKTPVETPEAKKLRLVNIMRQLYENNKSRFSLAYHKNELILLERVGPKTPRWLAALIYNSEWKLVR